MDTLETELNDAATSSSTSRWKVFIWGFVVGSVVTILIGGAMPLIKSGQHDAPLGEALVLGGVARDRLRVRYSKDRRIPWLLDSTSNHTFEEFTGRYYATLNLVSYEGPGQAAVYVVTDTDDYQTLRIRFRYEDGDSHWEHMGPFGGVRR